MNEVDHRHGIDITIEGKHKLLFLACCEGGEEVEVGSFFSPLSPFFFFPSDSVFFFLLVC